MKNDPVLIDDILSNLNIVKLNPMQLASIEKNQKHDHVILLSPTGSGKTLAFLLPLIHKMSKELDFTQSMIVVPSRELALQIESVFKNMRTGFKVSCCYGGRLRATEENNLTEAPALIIGTPGRICDHLKRGNIKPAHISTLVLDEYDKLLETGFLEEVGYITNSLPAIQKVMLTSATQINLLPDLLEKFTFESLDFLDSSKDERLAIQKVISNDVDKIDTLFKVICQIGARPMIVFCNHKDAVERVSQLLSEKGIYNQYYHGSLEQRDRESVLCKFRNGTVNVLITTDLASRGLDIQFIRYIIHYHLPVNEQAFIHRNGRTARMESSGTALLIISPDEKIPAYIAHEVEEFSLLGIEEIPDKPKWVTFYLPLGKKDKINKVDIAGFLSHKGSLKKEDIGLIEVKDFSSFVAVRRSKANEVLHLIKDEKIKNKKAKFQIAK